MLPQYFMYLAALLNLAACGNYFLATLRGKVQPNRVSWLMWGLISVITTFAQWFGKGGLSTLVVMTTAVGPLAVFAASFANDKAYWKTSRIDIVCGILSAMGLTGWATMNTPSVAIGFGIAADWAANVPTIRKAWVSPESENAITYGLGMLSGILAVTSLSWPWTFNSAAYVTSFWIGNTILFLVASRPRITEMLRKAVAP